MASYRYNTYRRYTAAYRVVKLQAKDKLFFCLPLNLGCSYRRNIYLADTCVQSGYYSHSFRYCQNNYRTSFLTPVLWHKKSPEGLMRFNVIFSRYHYIWNTCVLHLIKISCIIDFFLVVSRILCKSIPILFQEYFLKFIMSLDKALHFSGRPFRITLDYFEVQNFA